DGTDFQMDLYCYLGSGQDNHFFLHFCTLVLDRSMFVLQGPAQAQDLRDSLAEAKSDIVVKVSSSLLWTIYQPWCMELSVYMNTKLTERCTTGSNDLGSTRHQTSL
ncbi:hypothetical protein SETIT_3G209000v2, partial [Setaria italica]